MAGHHPRLFFSPCPCCASARRSSTSSANARSRASTRPTPSSRTAAARRRTQPSWPRAAAPRRRSAAASATTPWGNVARAAAARGGRRPATGSRASPGLRTPLAFVVVNEPAEPDFVDLRRRTSRPGCCRSRIGSRQAIAAHDALLLGSNTLLGARERALTLRARELRRRRGQARPVRSRTCGCAAGATQQEAVRLVGEVLDGAPLLKVNRVGGAAADGRDATRPRQPSGSSRWAPSWSP